MTTSPAEPQESTLAAEERLCDAVLGDGESCCEAVADPALDFTAKGLGYSQAWRACTPEHRIRVGVQLFLAGNWTLPPDLLPAILAAARIAQLEAALAAAEAKLAAVEALAARLESERDNIREAYRQHNMGRKEGRPDKRPDLATWGNAYEVAARHLRAALATQPAP